MLAARTSPLLTILLCLASLPLLAQRPSSHLPSTVYRPSSTVHHADKFSRYQHYTMEQGLSNNWVTGSERPWFLWFGTAEGLNRFDGEHFAPFYRADGKGLPVDHVA